MLIDRRGACPPTVSIALSVSLLRFNIHADHCNSYQYTGFALNFPTVGYLVAIVSVLSLCVVPRAKFFQTMAFNLVGVCIGSSVALLTCYCSVQARLHTSEPISTTNVGSSGTTQAVGYNSSASAVCGVWLFFNILFANALRFSRPQLQTPVILYSIFASVSGTYAPIFATMAQSLAFVEQLLKAFLTGFSIATVVRVLVFPRSSRDIMQEEIATYLSALKRVFMAQQKYLRRSFRDCKCIKGLEGSRSNIGRSSRQSTC